jgi:uncharacterized protein (TIGR03435 family)
MNGSGITIARLIDMLSVRVGRPIVDKTNLTESYDFTLKFSFPLDGNPDLTNESSGPTIFTALQEQLGLKLETAKGPIEVVVIDSVQKPTEN